eukprot:jgi/Mesvir1/1507/Mv14490-RA.1
MAGKRTVAKSKRASRKHRVRARPTEKDFSSNSVDVSLAHPGVSYRDHAEHVGTNIDLPDSISHMYDRFVHPATLPGWTPAVPATRNPLYTFHRSADMQQVYEDPGYPWSYTPPTGSAFLDGARTAGDRAIDRRGRLLGEVHDSLRSRPIPWRSRVRSPEDENWLTGGRGTAHVPSLLELSRTAVRRLPSGGAREDLLDMTDARWHPRHSGNRESPLERLQRLNRARRPAGRR